MDKESVLLTLHTQKISSPTYATVTFKSIPIKQIMGDMYNKYNKFKIVLNSHGCNFTNTSRLQQWYIRLTGLDWINTSQYSPTLLYNEAPLIPLYYVSFAIPQVRNLQCNNGFIFSKPSNQMIDLTITFMDQNFNIPTYEIGSSYFLFSIYGVEEE